MGRVKLNKKYKEYTGMLPPNGHRFYLTNRFGQEVISHMPEHRDPDSVTEAQRQAFQLIKQASALADADLRDPSSTTNGSINGMLPSLTAVPNNTKPSVVSSLPPSANNYSVLCSRFSSASLLFLSV